MNSTPSLSSPRRSSWSKRRCWPNLRHHCRRRKRGRGPRRQHHVRQPRPRILTVRPEGRRGQGRRRTEPMSPIDRAGCRMARCEKSERSARRAGATPQPTWRPPSAQRNSAKLRARKRPTASAVCWTADRGTARGTVPRCLLAPAQTRAGRAELSWRCMAPGAEHRGRDQSARYLACSQVLPEAAPADRCGLCGL
jgi:hypothetical protein